MGLLTEKDLEIFRNFFLEVAKLRGITVKYVYPVTEETSIHGEIFPNFSSIIKLDIIFESAPKLKTLKNYGWVSESSEDKPYIAYLPYNTPNIQTMARIEISGIGNNGKSGRWFEIRDIAHSIEFPDAYICKLAPVFINETEKLDYSETNNNYIDGDNQPDESTNHIEEINENLEDHVEENLKSILDNNFNYLKI